MGDVFVIGAVVLAFVAAALVVRVGRVLIERSVSWLDIVGADNRTAVHANELRKRLVPAFVARGIRPFAG